MSQTCKSGSHLQSGSQLEKWVRPGKMKKLVTHAKMGHTLKNVSHLVKWTHYKKNGSLVKMGHFFKNGSHLENSAAIGKMGHS